MSNNKVRELELKQLGWEPFGDYWFHPTERGTHGVKLFFSVDEAYSLHIDPHYGDYVRNTAEERFAARVQAVTGMSIGDMGECHWTDILTEYPEAKALIIRLLKRELTPEEVQAHVHGLLKG